MDNWKEQEVAEFALAVISKRTIGNTGAEYEKSGSGKDWQDCLTLSFDGFNNARILSLGNIWRDVLENKKTEFTGEVLAQETIVKLGETIRLETPYEVEIKVSYQ